MNEVALPSPLERSLARLARSRLSLRTAMLPQKDRLDAERGDGAVLPRRLRAWLRSGPLASLTRALEPWIGDAQRTLRRWWRRHPWRPSVEVVMDLEDQFGLKIPDDDARELTTVGKAIDYVIAHHA